MNFVYKRVTDGYWLISSSNKYPLFYLLQPLFDSLQLSIRLFDHLFMLNCRHVQIKLFISTFIISFISSIFCKTLSNISCSIVRLGISIHQQQYTNEHDEQIIKLHEYMQTVFNRYRV